MAQRLYTYTPLTELGPECIRLLRIVSPPGKATKCSLESYRLDDAPPYDCLSYTWGDAIDRSFSSWAAKSWRPMTGERNMLVTHVSQKADGQSVHTLIRVTENLLDALYQLGKHGYAHGRDEGHVRPSNSTFDNPAENPFQREAADLGSGQPRVPNSEYLWIDAICINQDDDVNKEEKQSQVAMMGKIYEHAQKVIIWLGRDDEYSGDACEVMERLAACDGDPDNPINKPDSRKPSFAIDGIDIDDALDEVCKFLGMEDNPIVTVQWQSYCAFLRRGWFGRAWVLQERFFARRTEGLCGEHLVEWDTISRCASVLLRTNAHVILQTMVLKLLDIQETTGTRLSDNRINNQSLFGVIHKDNAASLHLEDLLYYSRFVDATDPKDHVYALLGIWSEAQTQRGVLPAKLKQMTPKYDKSLADVYIEATMLAIGESGHLNIINLVQTGIAPSIPNLPSWVPNYAQSVRMQCLLMWPHSDDTVQTTSWMASQGLPHAEPILLPMTGQGGTQADKCHVEAGLVVSGQYVDHVVDVGPTHGEIDYECKLVDLLKLIPHHTKQKQLSPYTSPQEAFWRTIIKDTFRKGQPAKEEGRAAFLLFMAMRLTELEDQINFTKEDGNDPEQNLLKVSLSTLDRLSSDEQIWDNSDHGRTLVFRSASEMAKLQKSLQAENSFDQGIDRPLCGLMRDFEVSFWETCSGRRVFTTAGGYFGLTTESVQRGDEVWILAGASTPFVLRRQKAHSASTDAWKVVGEAYVHGIMYGEGVHSAEKPRQVLLV